MGRKTDKTATAVALWRIVAAVIVLLVGAGIFCWKTNSLKPTPAYDITEILPTCTENGYRLYRNRNTGETSVRDISAALGHRFSTWSVRQPVGALSCGLQVRTCEICNLEEQQIIYPELTVACLGIEGDLNGIGKKSEVPVDVHFVSENLAFDCYGTIKHQGHSSLQYDKKNFTI